MEQYVQEIKGNCEDKGTERAMLCLLLNPLTIHIGYLKSQESSIWWSALTLGSSHKYALRDMKIKIIIIIQIYQQPTL